MYKDLLEKIEKALNSCLTEAGYENPPVMSTKRVQQRRLSGPGPYVTFEIEGEATWSTVLDTP